MMPADWLTNFLAALGPMLCLHRRGDAHLLAGFMAARRMEVAVRIDSDGICESLRFFDAQDAPCWHLCLLPDSNYWAWDALISQLPEQVRLSCGDRERALCSLRSRPAWRPCTVRFRQCTTSAGPMLAATPVTLSDTGFRESLRLAHRLGAEIPTFH